MQGSLSSQQTEELLARLREANGRFAARYPGERADRQPVHTVYGGAQLFKSDTAVRIGEVARTSLARYSPDFTVLARAIGLRGAETLPDRQDDIATLEAALREDPAAVRLFPEAHVAFTLYERVKGKLEREAVEDFRIDFEDGYGNRPDAEEDATAVHVAKEVAKGLAANALPPFIGIRIKTLNEELRMRAIRTFASGHEADTPGRKSRAANPSQSLPARHDADIVAITLRGGPMTSVESAISAPKRC
jgi:hypothetical protein